MRSYYREKKFICGDYMDIEIYPVYPAPRSRREKRKPSSEVQQKLNAKNATKKLLRIVHTNFKPRDLEITFTYRDECRPSDEKTAKHDIQNFFRRARRLYKKNNIDLKYIWIMERSKNGKIHFHVFMSGGIERTTIEELWDLGYANSKSLKFNENGIAGLAYYVLKDKPLTYRRWSCSKNLKKPEERQNDYRITRRTARKLYADSHCYKDFKKSYPEYTKYLGEYEISEIDSQHNGINGEYYLTVRLYKKSAPKRGKK